MRAILKRLREAFGLVDLQALSGIRRILGVSVEEGAVRVAEVARKGNPFIKTSARFEVVSAIEVPLISGEPPEETGKKVAAALESRGIRTKSAVAGLRASRIREAEATLPSSARDVEGWIRERMPELLKLPIKGNEFLFRSKSLREGRVSITFARGSDVERLKKVMAEAGLFNLAIVPESDVTRGEIRGLLQATAGTGASAASLLALVGFLPELIRSDFLFSDEQEARNARLAQLLFKRAVLVTGSLLLILLLFVEAVGRYLEARLSELEEKSAALAPRVERIEELTRQVTLLESRLGERSSALTRSDVSRVLQAVAASTPKNVRLSRIRFEEVKEEVFLSGFAEHEEAVTRLLKNLTGAFREIQLIRSGAPRRAGGASQVMKRDLCEFEIRMKRGT